jgi:glycosyltransferase involved in cell wall biosynthesis
MEGLDLTHRKEVIVANSSEDMAKAIAHLLQNPSEAMDMGGRGREWALRHLGHQARAQAWTSFLHQAVKA